MKTNLKSQLPAALLCACMAMLQGCSWFKSEPAPKKTSKSITALDFGLVTNELVKIDEEKGIIWVNIPWQNAWNLQAFITHTGVKIEPADSQFRDYKAPVNYTITAEDGSTKTYTVIVSSAKGQVIFNSPSLFRNQDQDFYKYAFAVISNTAIFTEGRDFLIVAIGGNIVVGRKDNFAFDIYVPALKLNGQLNVLGNFSAVSTSGSPKVILHLNEITGIPGLRSTTNYSIGSLRGNIRIDTYDSRLKTVSGNCQGLEFRNIDTGQIYTASCDFLNVPIE